MQSYHPAHVFRSVTKTTFFRPKLLRSQRRHEFKSSITPTLSLSLSPVSHFSSATTWTPPEHLPNPTYTRRLSDAWPEDELATLSTWLRPRHDETLDLILRQRIFLLQARRGYRANVDCHILANFATSIYDRCNPLYNDFENSSSTSPRQPRVLDLGAGTGIVSILFCRARGPPKSLHLVELQPILADRARRNLFLNDLGNDHSFEQENVQVHVHDLANGHLPAHLHHAFDVVLVNPPFYPNIGQRNPPRSMERRLAHTESTASFTDFMRAAYLACDERNQNAFIAVIHDIRERERTYKAFSDARLLVKTRREMCHFSSENASRLLFHLQPIRENSQITHPSHAPFLKPIVLHLDRNSKNIYTEEIEAFFHRLPYPSRRIGRLREKSDSD